MTKTMMSASPGRGGGGGARRGRRSMINERQILQHGHWPRCSAMPAELRTEFQRLYFARQEIADGPHSHAHPTTMALTRAEGTHKIIKLIIVKGY